MGVLDMLAAGQTPEGMTLDPNAGPFGFLQGDTPIGQSGTPMWISDPNFQPPAPALPDYTPEQRSALGDLFNTVPDAFATSFVPGADDPTSFQNKRTSEWQSNLRAGDQDALEAIPQGVLDAIWPVTQGGGMDTPYGQGSTPNPRDPFGGWFTLTERSMQNPHVIPYQAFAGGPSTNNWRLLPAPYNTPDYIMRGGHIISKFFQARPAEYVVSRGSPTGNQLGAGGAYPMSAGYFYGDRSYFWPGQIEPWVVGRGILG
jgi:hypothetical protein